MVDQEEKDDLGVKLLHTETEYIQKVLEATKGEFHSWKTE